MRKVLISNFVRESREAFIKRYLSRVFNDLFTLSVDSVISFFSRIPTFSQCSKSKRAGTKERFQRSIPPITELRKHSWNSTRHAWDKEIECLLLKGAQFFNVSSVFFYFSVSFSQMRTCIYVRALALPFLLSPSKLDFTVYPTSPPIRTPTQKTTLGRNGKVSFDRIFHKFGPAIQVDHASIMLMSWFNIIIPNHAFE